MKNLQLQSIFSRRFIDNPTGILHSRICIVIALKEIDGQFTEGRLQEANS